MTKVVLVLAAALAGSVAISAPALASRTSPKTPGDYMYPNYPKVDQLFNTGAYNAQVADRLASRRPLRRR